MLEKVSHSSRRYVGILLSCRYYDGLDLRSELSVGICNRSLGLEVYHVANAPHDMIYAELTAYVYGQCVILDDAHALEARSRLLYYAYALLIRKEAALVNVDTHSHYDFIKHRKGPFENIEMSRSKRIEGSRE